jgi:hypothetical protein
MIGLTPEQRGKVLRETWTASDMLEAWDSAANALYETFGDLPDDGIEEISLPPAIYSNRALPSGSTRRIFRDAESRYFALVGLPE